MTTRRELTQAVVEAARRIVARYKCGLPADMACKPDKQALINASDALDACTEPDLAALDEAVAEAVEEYRDTMRKNKPGLNDAWEEVCSTIDARREALKPNPRYRAAHNGVIIDDNLNIPMLAEEVAALLNAKEKP
jgi:hypothetical protein